MDIAPSIPFQYALDSQEVLKKSQSSFFKAFRFLPEDQALDLGRVYAFCTVVDECVDQEADRADQKLALEFWRDQFDKAIEGSESHNITLEVVDVMQRRGIPKEYFYKLFEGCEMDLEQKRFETIDDLYEYCVCVAGVVGLMCMRIFGHHSPSSDKAALSLGFAFQLTNIMRDVNEDWQRGRLYLPQDLLNRCGYSEEDLNHKVSNAAFFLVMKELFDLASQHYDYGAQEFERDKVGRLVATRVMSKTYRALLNKMASLGFPVWKRRVRLSYFEKLKILLPFLMQHKFKS